MSKSVVTPGAEVITPRGRGVVVDVRATPSGQFVVGVEDATGEVGYFTQKALRLRPPTAPDGSGTPDVPGG